MDKFYITTAIDYPSNLPHIGHAYEKICADVIARYYRLKGKDVFFLTGTDEHGQKIYRYAKKAKQEPAAFVEKMSKKFVELCKKLDISNDDFIRTTQPRHTKVVSSIFKKIYDKGDIYKGQYEGLYCVDCESFYTKKDLVRSKCPVHKKGLDWLKEETYFFKLSKYKHKIFEYIRTHPDFIQPQTRRNEIIGRLEEDLRDLSVSRSSFDWGIPLPMDKGHIVFVWFDALVNYVSGIDYPNEKFKRYWPVDLHLIGKDILWFHTVVWPAILLAVELPFPKKIFVHGFVNISGAKISKSKGETVDPLELIEKFGTDAIRYFLLREIPFGQDGDFSKPALIKRINSDLANDLGNLVYRTLTMVEKHLDGKIPGASKKNVPTGYLAFLGQKIESLPKEVECQMQGLNLSICLEKIWELINIANKSIEETKPWILSREKRIDELSSFLYLLIEALRTVADSLSAFLPSTSNKIINQLGKTKIKKGKPLFPRIDVRPVREDSQ